MTLPKGLQKAISLCSCGSPFQGERYKKHGQHTRARGDEHALTKRVWYCAPCNERREEGRDFPHHDCLYVSLSKTNMKAVLEGRDIVGLKALVDEVDLDTGRILLTDVFTLSSKI